MVNRPPWDPYGDLLPAPLPRLLDLQRARPPPSTLIYTIIGTGKRSPQISQAVFSIKPQTPDHSDSSTKIGELRTHELGKSAPPTRLVTLTHQRSITIDDEPAP
ncbi:hypothetical protein TIFTF001_016980 [Ficus carica]|uniref:Uncharacterized protein n=1 Tax=Ficus carica TaxID=3494 RepID=A0AA88A9R4_FICCA|nr:hypothetical protein TIFTF001_016980 [Ficus carica]